MEPHEFIASARRAAGISQSELAARVGKNDHWVSNRETGKTRLTLGDAALLANALGVSDQFWKDLRFASVA